MRRFFEGVPPDLFLEGFHDRLRFRQWASPLEMACEQAFLYLGSSDPLNHLIAIERLHELLAKPAAADVLRQCYDFTVLSFGRLLKTVDLFGRLTGQQPTLAARLQECEQQLRLCQEQRQARDEQLRSIFASRSWRI